MPKILVTGGAGFIGSNLVDELINQNHQVVVIDNLSNGKEEFINPKAKFYKLDICSGEAERVFQNEKFDYVFHLAAQIDVNKSVEDPEFDKKVNELGSISIFKFSEKYKVKKVIFTSTGGAIYGNVNGAANENTPPSPISPYADHKLVAEIELDRICKTSDLAYTILRLANVYGPRQYKGGEGAVVGVFTANAINSQESTLFGDGGQTRDFVYVGDVVEACIISMKKDVQGIFNIGSGAEISILDLIQSIENIIGRKMKIKQAETRAGDVRTSVLDSSKAEKELGWTANTKLEEGIKKTVNWYQRHKENG